MFARDRNVSVRERPRPGYEALGGRIGAFMAYPKLEVGGEYNDNIYAVSAGQSSDWIVRVKPQLVLQSDWSRHAARVYGSGTFNRYLNFGSEDTTDWDAGADLRLDVQRDTNVSFGGEDSKLTEPRTSASVPLAAASPVQYTLGQAYATGQHVFNRLKLSTRGDYKDYNYISVARTGGGIIDQNDRDRSFIDAIGRADYAISPDTAAFVQVTGNWRNYRKPGSISAPARDSKGYEVLAGVNFDLTALIRGEVGVGYISQDFTSSLYGDVSGFGARASLEWFPTQLTTVTAKASRSVEDSGILGSGGYLSTNAGLQIDHELLRNVILTANGNYGRDAYNGIARTDTRYTAGVGATYLLNRRVGVNAGYNYFKQDSSGTAGGTAFRVNRVTLGLVLQY